MATQFHQEKWSVDTQGRSTYEISQRVQQAVASSEIETGLCNVFVHHTSASLILCENADPMVRGDLEAFLIRLVPDGDAIFQHIDEGDDDMPAHVRTILTQSSISIPVEDGRAALGTWQGIYLYEHRTHPHRRRISASIIGV